MKLCTKRVCTSRIPIPKVRGVQIREVAANRLRVFVVPLQLHAAGNGRRVDAAAVNAAKTRITTVDKYAQSVEPGFAYR